MNIKTKIFNPKEFQLVITSGPTREWLDPVRFISNPSTGITGYFLAKFGLEIYKNVTYIAGYTTEQFKNVLGANNISVDNTQSMANAVFKELKDNTILIMAAAPADFTPSYYSEKKIKKNSEDQILVLKPTIDILKTIGIEKQKNYKNLILVGFAAETDNIKNHALEKLEKKNIHFVCANQVYKTQKGFSSLENTIYIYDRWGGEVIIGPDSKEIICKKILEYLNKRITEIFDRV